MNRSIRMRLLSAALLCAFAPLAVSGADPDEQTRIANDAYLYGLQQVIFYETRFNYTQNKGSSVYEGINRWNLVNDGNPIDATFKAIVTPNATTAYAIGFLDLQKEPVVLEMPEVTDHYFSLQIMDQYGVFHLYAGTQFNGTKARSYLIVPQDYEGKIPAEFVTTNVIKTRAKTLCGIIRYARQDPSNDEEKRLIKKLLAQSTITPVSKWIANGNRGLTRDEQPIVAGDYRTFPKMKDLTQAQVDKQTPEDFFTLLQLALDDPAMTVMKDSAMEGEMLASLKSIGLGKGQGFDWSKLDKKTQDALSAGFKAGHAQVKKAGRKNMVDMNGWATFINAGGFETDWLARAIMADFGWLGPDRNISHSASLGFADADGQKLDGKFNYTITFDMNKLPPVTQFWSIPIYDADGYFVDNEIDRYSINSFQLKNGLFHIENDKLIIYIQHDKPKDSKRLKNWLPAPDSGFRFAPRFYGPRYSLIDGSYEMPRVARTK